MDIAPTYPIYNQGYNPLTIRGMNHQAVQILRSCGFQELLPVVRRRSVSVRQCPSQPRSAAAVEASKNGAWTMENGGKIQAPGKWW